MNAKSEIRNPKPEIVQATVACEQAVFTSVRTPMGEGYRIIAASTGLTPEEKTEITKRSPSHGGLCGSDEHATAIAFYQLPGERLCAAMSCMAGKEQSGRGGLRVYTRAVVLDRSAFSAFAHNPFNVLRAMEACGMGPPDLKPEKTLPVVELPKDPVEPVSTPVNDRLESLSHTINRVGIDWVIYTLHAAQAGRQVILASEDDPCYLIEAAILSLPQPLRAGVSFSWGLKFSIGRTFTLTAVSGDTTGTERIIRGHPLVLVRPQADSPTPPYERNEWQNMVADHWSEAAYHELQDFTSKDFPDCSTEALERVAVLRNETSRASVAEAIKLLSMAECRLKHTRGNDFEARMLADLLNTIRMRLEHIWSNASDAELAADWPILVAFLGKSPAAFRFAIPLVGLILRRSAAMSPLTALLRALDVGGEETARAITDDLREVVEAVERWLPQAEPAAKRTVTKAIKRWRKAFPSIPQPTAHAHA